MRKAGFIYFLLLAANGDNHDPNPRKLLLAAVESFASISSLPPLAEKKMTYLRLPVYGRLTFSTAHDPFIYSFLDFSTVMSVHFVLFIFQQWHFIC